MKQAIALLLVFSLVPPNTIPVWGCTGIKLTAQNGGVVFARTLEWGSFDMKSRLVIVPRGVEFSSPLEGSRTGLTWKSQFGAVGVDALEKDYLVDGMNEKGLSVNLFYHPGFADYPAQDDDNLARSIGPLDVPMYLLTTCETVEAAKAAMSRVTLVSVSEPAIGFAPPVHVIVTEPSGKAVVFEFVNKEMQTFDATLGVITNSPQYDWHMTNLRNYVNLSAVAWPAKKIEEIDFSPLGGGSGMLGLPGDFTPPSRFVRAVAFTKTARETETARETMYEAFRILDNFNVPLGAAEGGGQSRTEGMRSATIWTTAYDTKNLVMQYHTMHNRRVRQVDLRAIDFSGSKDLTRLPLDQQKQQDIKDVTPR